MAAMTKEAPAYVCSHVFRRERPVLLVAHEDDDWQFLCGGDHEDDEVPHVVGLNHLLDEDASLSGVMDLPEAWEAERAAQSEPWQRFEIQG